MLLKMIMNDCGHLVFQLTTDYEQSTIQQTITSYGNLIIQLTNDYGNQILKLTIRSWKLSDAAENKHVTQVLHKVLNKGTEEDCKCVVQML